MAYSCFRIYDQNYVSLEILANAYYSSQQASFPASNVYNFQRRSKVWRTNGRYEVTSSNNTIIFRESTGVDLTATVAASDYTSTTTFMNAVKTALDAAGTSTYTITQDNLKFKISSNGVGGTGIFELRCADASFTAEGILGYDTVNRTGSLNYTGDFVTIHYPSEYLLWDMGISTNPDAFILIGLRNSSLPYSPTAVIKLEGNETNNFTSPSFSSTLDYDDEVISLVSNAGIATTGYRYWKLSIDDKVNGNGYIQVSSCFLGNYFNPERGRAQFPLTKNFIDRSKTVFSEGGQSFSDIKEQTAKFSVQFKALQKASIEEFEGIFNTYGTSKPLFVSMDSNEVFSTSRNRRIIYCKFDTAPQWTLASKDFFNLTLNFREEL